MNQVGPPAECAVCGADIPTHARACPECGADERTGWREQSIYDGLDLPEEESDHADFVAKEADDGVPRKGASLFWWIIAVLMLGVVVVLVLRNLFRVVS